MRRPLKSIVRREIFAFGVLAAILPLGCREAATKQPGKDGIHVKTTTFSEGTIPRKDACREQGGEDVSPELSWDALPAGTKSIALIVRDVDAPLGTLRGYFTHWTLYDLPPGERELPEGVPQDEQLESGARQGRNDFGRIGYGGPCPPGHLPHHYVFSVYALDAKLGLPAGAKEKEVEEGMQGHILARGEITGRYAASD
ncbi:MAG TPA: YbhB/YbcL family Raf kinase inhibitor-like protein [Candidatus Acidoferrum sp.]|nr:YbhB/YbcL family Raf kinase inhibitor-like protein [Candidatus Acidoferrum sp.]